MNKPKLTQREIAQLKRIAANVNADVIKRDKLEAKKMELQKEIDKLTATIDLSEAPVKVMTGGYTTSDLLKKTVEDTGKVDKDGRPIKTTKYVLIYPETILPPAEEAPTAEPAEEGMPADPENPFPTTETPTNE